MKYDITRRAFPLGSDFLIRDADGMNCYFIDGRAVTLRDKLLFLNMEGELLATIRQKLFAWGTTHLIYREGMARARIRKKVFPMHRHKFDVETSGEINIWVSGDFHGREFSLRRQANERLIARVSSRWGLSQASYGVELADDEDDPILVLATCAVIDLVLRDELPK